MIAIPTVVLSSHAAYPHLAGTSIDTENLDRIAEAVEANDWLAGIDVIITGYLPSPAHVTFAARLVQRIRTQNRAALYVCDPVLGDAPKGLYLPAETASSIKKDLLPLADIVTPNAFELSWLTGLPVTSLSETSQARIRARQTYWFWPPLSLPGHLHLATSTARVHQHRVHVGAVATQSALRHG